MLKLVSSSKTLISLQCYSPNSLFVIALFDAHTEINSYGILAVMMKCYSIYMPYVVRTGSFPSMDEQPVSTMQHTYT